MSSPFAVAEDRVDRQVAGAAVGLQHDVRLHLLSARVVRNGHHRGIHHLRQVLQHRFDLSRGDVLSGTPHHVFQAPHDVEPAAFVLTKQVAGAEPFAEIGGGVRFRLPVVAEHASGPTYDELADLAHRNVLVVLVDDAALAERGRLAARAGTDHLRGLEWHVERRADLGHSESFHCGRVEAPAQIGVNFLAHAVDVGTAEADVAIARAGRLLVNDLRE